jgi:hypothetical protein
MHVCYVVRAGSQPKSMPPSKSTGNDPVFRHSSDNEELREPLAFGSGESGMASRKFFRATRQCFFVVLPNDQNYCVSHRIIEVEKALELREENDST